MARIYGILGDIHANIDALDAVMRDAAEQGVLVRIKAVGIERILDGIALDGLLREVLQLRRDMQFGVGVGIIQVWNRLDIANLHLGFGGERHGAEDARQAEHILTFEEGTV